MCLQYSQEDTDEIRARLEASPTKSITYYKTVILKENGDLESAFRRKNIKLDENGYYCSNRTSKEVMVSNLDNYEYITVSRGIHVYVDDPAELIRMVNKWLNDGRKRIVVLCECHLDDFVAAGYDCEEAVFMKVKLVYPEGANNV